MKTSPGCLSGLAGACALVAASLWTLSAEAQPVIATPSGYGHYCSGTRTLGSPSSHLQWGSSSTLPCVSCTPGSFCTIQQAGLWNPNGVNRVYAICADGARFWGAASGDSAILNVQAAAASHPRCTFNISPKELPIFNRPYSAFRDALLGVEGCEVVGGVLHCYTESSVAVGYGVDLADHTTFSLAQLGLPGVGNPNRVDHMAHLSPANNSHPIRNDHGGYDWRPVFDNTNDTFGAARVRAVAPGRVVSAITQGAGDPCPGQVEVFIRHLVGSSATSAYREEFYSYYSHLEATTVVAGQDVVAFHDLGEMGQSGGACAGGEDHIHFSTIRIRNVTGALMVVPPIGPADWDTTGRRMIDPFGWNGPSYDPWAFFAPAGFGAASIHLWKSPSNTPPDWAAH